MLGCVRRPFVLIAVATLFCALHPCARGEDAKMKPPRWKVGEVISNSSIEAQPGDRFRIDVRVKGKGRAEVSVTESDKSKRYPHIRQHILGTIPLTETYTKRSFIYEPVGQVTERLLRRTAWFSYSIGRRERDTETLQGKITVTYLGRSEKEVKLETYWPDERVILLSEDESKRANLVARSDYAISPRWAIRLVKGRPFWWTLRHGWLNVEWLKDEPLLKYCLHQVGYGQRRYAALREFELYGPGGPDNLARSPGVKLMSQGDVMEAGGRLHSSGYASGIGDIGKEWKNLHLLTDGQAPTDTKFEWVKVKDAAHYGPGRLPIRAWAGVEFPEPKMVSKAVIHHGHNMNHTILGEYVAQADVADNFVLEYSANGKTWQAIPGTATENNRKSITVHRFEPVKAKAVRVHIDGQAAPISPVPGKAWKNIHWALREYAARGIAPSNESSEERLSSRKIPFIGMEPYRRLAYAVSGPDRERLRRYFEPVMKDFERHYGDAFLGFILWEWDNDLFKAFQGVPEYDRPKSWKTKYEYMMKGLQSAQEIYRGHTICQGSTRPYGHYAFEAGAKAVMDEQKGGYTSGMFQVQTTFLRSAARQYGRFWGTYPTPRLGLIRQENPPKSEFSPDLARGGSGFDLAGGWYRGPFQGVSPYWWKRMLYGNYFAGQNFQDMELGSGAMIYNTRQVEREAGNVNRGYLIPQGIVTRDMARFIEKHLERGTLYTPIAFAIDYWGGWTPRRAGWPGQSWRWGDDEIMELMLTFFPVCGRAPLGFGYEVANKDMADTPFGESCDVLKPNPPSGVISQDALDDYKILWIAGSWRGMPDDLVARMKAYVRAGGTLVVNAAHLQGGFPGGQGVMSLDEDILGVALTGQEKSATDAVFLLDDAKRKPLNSVAFRYAVVTPGPAEVIAKTGAGHPLITLNKVGKGHVILTTTWYNLTDQLRIAPVAERLIAYLTRQALPVEVKGRIRYLVTRRKDGWVVVLINNKGIFKSSQANAEVDHLARETVDLVLRAPSTHVSEWSQDYTSWPFKVIDGKTHCGITVPAGDVRILHFRMR